MTHLETKTKAALAAAALATSSFMACGGGERAVETRPIAPKVELNKPRAPIGSPIEMTYRFEVGADSAPIPKDYRVFVHFVDSHDAILFTGDHDPPKPTSAWEPGSTIEYTRTLFIPLYPYLGTATVSLGLHVPETGERLGLEGPGDGNQAYPVAQLELLDQKENIFLVYKEGWHQLESAPENPSIEWQWTKQEAVCSFRNPKRDVLLYLEADSNVNAFEEEPLEVALMVGENEVSRFTVETKDTFLRKISIPASALGSDDWVDLRIVNSKAFVPSQEGLGNDDRELGLRVYHLYVESLEGT